MRGKGLHMIRTGVVAVLLGSLATFAGAPDYRIGLHTHMGYPRDLAAALDAWNARLGRSAAGWLTMDEAALTRHAETFAPSLLVHGGLAWEMETRAYRLKKPIAAGENRAFLTSTERLQAGEWLFVGREAWIVRQVAADGLVVVSRHGSARAAFPAGAKATAYRSVLNRRAAETLRRYRGGPVLAQITTIPGAPKLPDYFAKSGKKPRESWSLSGDGVRGDYLYAHPRFQPPALFTEASTPGKTAAEPAALDGFMRRQFRQYLDDVIAAGGQVNGASKIAYWLLGNEPDSMLPIEPAFYARWTTLLAEVLEERGHSGKIVLANVNGGNAQFDVWLDRLGDAFADMIAAGELDSRRPPFQAAAITFYLNPFALEREPLEVQTRRHRRGIDRIRDLFADPGSIAYIVKEAALQDISEADRVRLDLPARPFLAGQPLDDAAKTLIRRYVAHLKQAGYAHVVWFNQMPTGAWHGDLIEDAATARETSLGRFLRALNQPPPQPLSLDVRAIGGTRHWRAELRKTELAFAHGPFRVWLYTTSGEARLIAEGDARMDGQTVRFATGGKLPAVVDGAWLDLRFDPDLTGFRRAFAVTAPLAPVAPLAADFPNKLELQFPDPALRDHMLENHDSNRDGVLSAGELGAVKFLDLVDKPVRDLTGVGLLENLRSLSVFNAPLVKTPPLDRLQALVTARFIDTELDAAPVLPVGLTTLVLDRNHIAEPPDLSRLPVLQSAVLGNMAWGRVPPQPPRLERLTVRNLGLSTLDGLRANRLTRLEIIDETLGSLDGLSGLNALETLRLENVAAPALDPGDLPPSLAALFLIGANFGAPLDLAAAASLTTLSIQRYRGQGLASASLPPNLSTLSLAGNALTALPDLTVAANLTDLDVSRNQLAALPPFEATPPKLVRLNCSGNLLSALPDLTPWRFLENLDCSDNNLTQFPAVNANSSLTRLDCRNNRIPVDQCLRAKRIQAQGRWTTTQIRFTANTFFFTPQKAGALDCEGVDADPGETPLASARAFWHGDDIILSWSGGARRNRQPESYDIFLIDGAPVQIARGVQSTSYRVEAAGGGARQYRVLWRARPSQTDADDVIELTVQPPPATGYVYNLPHAPRVPQWAAAVTLVNPGEETAAASLTAFDAQGAPLAETPILALTPGQSLETALDELFDPGLWPDLAWVQVVSDRALEVNHHIGLRSQPTVAEFLTPPTTGRQGAVFAPEPSPGRWTGLVMLNPGPLALETVLERRDSLGELIGQRTIPLEPGEKQLGLAAALFPEPAARDTHLSWRADRPLAVLSLQGDITPWTHMDGYLPTGDGVGSGVFPIAESGSTLTLINRTPLVNRVRLEHGPRSITVWLDPHGHLRVDLADVLPDLTAGALWVTADAPIEGFVGLRRADSDFGLAFRETVPMAAELGVRFAVPVPPSLDWRTTLYLAYRDPEPGVTRFRARNADGLILGQVDVQAQEGDFLAFEAQVEFAELPDMTAIEILADQSIAVYRLSVSTDRPGLMRGAPARPLPPQP